MDERDPLWPFFRVTGELQQSYQLAFAEGAGRAVLLDLAKLCFAYAPTTTEREQGMRDVWLHIQKRLALRDEELVAVLAKLNPEQRASMFDRSPVFAQYSTPTESEE